MNKTISIIFGVIFFFSSGSAMTAQKVRDSISDLDTYSEDYLQQVYRKNEYIIDQLEVLARSKNALPLRMGGHLAQVDMVLLLLKFNSVNFLMQKVIETDELVSVQLFNEDLIFEEDLVEQSNALLMKLPVLYEKFNLSIPVVFDELSTSGRSVSCWFDSTVTTEKLYKQLLRIESFLTGFRNIIEPENVYEVVMSTRALLLSSCGSLNNVKHVPLVMGKRPRDVYSRLFDFIDSLSTRMNISQPTKGPVHVLPGDVFGIAIVAMAYSRALQSEESGQLVKSEVRGNTSFTIPELVTPSHVYQAVVQNIELLECEHHAS